MYIRIYVYMKNGGGVGVVVLDWMQPFVPARQPLSSSAKGIYDSRDFRDFVRAPLQNSKISSVLLF